jgi:hypothetical protein
MASAELRNVFPEVRCIGDSVESVVEGGSNRRVHERLKASELRWMQSARLMYGAQVRVIDISAGGMMLQTQSELARDANVVLELTGAESPIQRRTRGVRLHHRLSSVETAVPPVAESAAGRIEHEWSGRRIFLSAVEDSRRIWGFHRPTSARTVIPSHGRTRTFAHPHHAAR